MARQKQRRVWLSNASPTPTPTVAPPMPKFGAAQPDPDGWSVVATKEMKKSQRARKHANAHIPLPPPLPPRSDPLDRPVIYQDRHQFTPTLSFVRTSSRNDFIRAANHTLNKFNTRTFDSFANSITISTLTRPGWHDYSLGTDVHHFLVGRVGLAARVPLLFKKNELMVLNRGLLTTFEDWLLSLPTVTGPDILGEAGYRMLYQWHRARGAKKRCPVLNDDVLQLVLLHAVGEVRPVTQLNTSLGVTHFSIERGCDNSLVRPDNGRLMLGIRSGQLAIEHVDRRLLCLSKAVSKLALRALRSATIKGFEDPAILRQAALYGAPQFLQFLTRVQLTFSDKQYFEFFQVNLPPCDSSRLSLPPRTATASVLTSLTNLAYLELWFASPSSQNNPGHRIPWHPSNHTFDTKLQKVTCRYPCRRKIVDYILCFAYPYVHYVPHVNITGYVKTSTRDEWLRILQDRRYQEAHLSIVAERIEGFQQMDELPVCECNVPCYFDAFNDSVVASERWTAVSHQRVKLHTERLLNYRFDFDDDIDTSKISEERLALRSYDV